MNLPPGNHYQAIVAWQDTPPTPSPAAQGWATLATGRVARQFLNDTLSATALHQSLDQQQWRQVTDSASQPQKAAAERE